MDSFLEKTTLQFDAHALRLDMLPVMRLAYPDAAPLEKVAELDQRKFASINLTHLEGLTGPDRFTKYSSNHGSLKAAGVSEADFKILPPEIKNIYMGECIRRVQTYHLERFGTPFVGRNQLAWVNPGACFRMHTDQHTLHRYHIPIYTDPMCYWIFIEDSVEKVKHMPADGSVWYVNPVSTPHSVANMGTRPRCHLLMTSSF